MWMRNRGFATAICSPPRPVGCPVCVHWRLPPTQRLRRPADTPARVTAARKVESSIRAYGLASQCRLRTPAIEAADHLLPFSAVNARLGCWFVQPSDRRSADVSVHTVEGHL